MAIGFPAKHQTSLSLPALTEAELERRLAEHVANAGWEIVEDQTRRLVCRTAPNFWTLAERVTVTWTEALELTVESRCALPTQIVDWGQNKRVVTALVEHLQRTPPTTPSTAGGANSPVAVPAARSRDHGSRR